MAKKKKKSKRPAWSVIQFTDIERWREKADMPNATLARALGVTTSTWYNWQNGRSIPPVGTQEKVRAFLLKNVSAVKERVKREVAAEPAKRRRAKKPARVLEQGGSDRNGSSHGLAERGLELIRSSDQSAFEAVASFFEGLGGFMREVQKLIKRQEANKMITVVARPA